MTTHCVMSKSQPFSFVCPSCEAKYNVVTFEAPSNMRRRRIRCLRCDALFPAGEGNIFLKYNLMAPRRG
jgi:predicted Zn finger-like uncharacterized protein